MSLDPIAQRLAAARALSDQQVAAYTEHLKGLVSAWRKHMAKYDRDALIQNSVKALMEDPTNTREALCYQVIVAVDMMARGHG
jgi:hypothetical protein